MTGDPTGEARALPSLAQIAEWHTGQALDAERRSDENRRMGHPYSAEAWLDVASMHRAYVAALGAAQNGGYARMRTVGWDPPHQMSNGEATEIHAIACTCRIRVWPGCPDVAATVRVCPRHNGDFSHLNDGYRRLRGFLSQRDASDDYEESHRTPDA